MRTTMKTIGAGALALALGGVLSARPASAQLPTAGVGHLGTAQNGTVLRTGVTTLGTNPALMGLPGNPGWSLVLPSVRSRLGLDPVTLSDLNDFSGSDIPSATRDEWLRRIEGEGSQAGAAGGHFGIGFSVGPVALQYSGLGGSRLNVNADAAELILFGNAGRTGETRDFNLQGSTMGGFATSTVAAGMAFPLDLELGFYEEESFSLGITLKYTIGHFVAQAQDNGSQVSDDPLAVDVRFPIVHSDTDDYQANNGSGIGVDIGAAWEGGPWRASAAVQNLLNTFEWDQDRLVFRPGEALFDEESSETSFDPVPISQGGTAASTLADQIGEQGFTPRVALGVGYAANERLDLTADFRQAFGDGEISLDPDTHLGVGAVFRPVPMVPLRAGAAYITDGFQFGFGAGLVLGPVNLAASWMIQTGDLDDATFFGFGLSFGAQ